MGLTSKLIASAVGMTVLIGTARAEDWPDLPVGIKNGIAARAENHLYVGLGSAGTDLYALDLTDRAAGWKKLAAFTGPAPSQPAVAVSGGAIYVFSGSGKATPEAAAPVVFDTVYRYDPAQDLWEQLATTTPVGLLGASAVTRADGAIAIFGGYNKAQFDDYLARITAIDKAATPDLWTRTVSDFMGRPPEAYQWNDLVLLYDPVANTWSDLGHNPHLPNTGAALVAMTPTQAALINGEVKPGLRTERVQAVRLDGTKAEWQDLPPLPAAAGSDRQEGVAGAFAGLIGGQVVVAGGANFPGAQARAAEGHWYAHEGLTKHWAQEIFVLTQDGWHQAGMLPEGLAYGAAFSLPEGLLIAGGEDAQGAARREVFLLSATDPVMLTP
ncbi:N-acetylneuraminate epimerase [Phaeovulum sp. W22_SRMD_FR3]|uniref:N-acetylneuraminate epimerase n=1 Tax=Phaeovulum sp. W22_SRMD_FR3 TaxID=3240274 RepID=UPI003F9A709F